MATWHAACLCRVPTALPARRRIVEPLADDVFLATLGQVPEEVAAVLMVARRTGARIGEVLGLTADRLDRSDPAVWWYQPLIHKRSHAGAPRLIGLGPRAQAAAGPWIDRWPWTVGYHECHRAIARACRATGLPRWTPHQLRHASGTEVRRLRGDQAVAYWLGHCTSRTMSHRYTREAWIEEARATIRAIAVEIG